MTDQDSLSLNPADWPDHLPPCLIRVDKEGRLWHVDAEMIHEGINRLLMSKVQLDDKGRYVIEFRGQRCFVEVEDSFFVIVRLDAEEDGNGQPTRLWITLNDGGREELDPASIFPGKDNVLYARVKEARFPARFLRKSYYQLAEFITEMDDGFGLILNGRHYPLSAAAGELG